jgi:hypothetical protein
MNRKHLSLAVGIVSVACLVICGAIIYKHTDISWRFWAALGFAITAKLLGYAEGRIWPQDSN